MSEEKNLDTATINDIIAELKQRGLRFALAIDQMRQYKAGGDIPSKDRQTYYSSEPHPLKAATLFCDGIQWALNDSEGTVVVSAQTEMLQHGIHRLWETLQK